MNDSCLIISGDNHLISRTKEICSSFNIESETIKGAFEALELIRLNPFILILLDNKNKSVISNQELVRLIRKSDKDIGIFMFNDSDLDLNEKGNFIKNGVSDFFIGENCIDAIGKRLSNLLYIKDLKYRLEELKEDLYKKYGFNHIIGNSVLMRRLFDSFLKLIDSNVTVFITGESGTGKEILAKEIHRKSPRRKNNFVAINCAAIPENLLESELFGHEKGSFTGASNLRIGKFELADKGTIFLDEIGEMPVHTQSKILRALEEKEIERVGGNDKIEVDVRIITATNKELDEEVQKGNFRKDLLYRVNVFPLYLPPLRERLDDIDYLTVYFLEKLKEKNKRNIISINPEVLTFLKSYDWPGNIRELENVIERSIILSNSSELEPENIQIKNDFVYDLKQEEQKSEFLIGDNVYPYDIYEKKILEHALNKCSGNIKKASELLKIGRSTFHRKIKKYNLDVN
ncbi:sigma 54-interacting transcriptional regulator [candidate division KSB1 bacterium]